MKKSIGRTLAHIDVAADTSVRIHEDFFNSHRDYHQLSQVEIGGGKRIYQHLSGRAGGPMRKAWFPIIRLIGS
jgi:hypothetical protein